MKINRFNSTCQLFVQLLCARVCFFLSFEVIRFIRRRLIDDYYYVEQIHTQRTGQIKYSFTFIQHLMSRIHRLTVPIEKKSCY